MANVLRLANNDQSTTVDFLSGTLKYQTSSWIETTAMMAGEYDFSPYGPQSRFSYFEPVSEIIELFGRDTATNLRAAVKSITTILEKSRRYHDDPWHNTTSGAAGPESWWLEWSIDGESTRRALLYTGSVSILHGGIGLTPMLECGQVLTMLQFTRHPLFESVSINQESHAWTTRLVTATDTFTSIPGEVPGRISQMSLTCDATEELYQAWVGIRPKGIGSTNFHSLWECEDGSAYNGATLSVADGNASPPGSGKSTQKSSPAASLTKYWDMSVFDVHSANGNINFVHNMGTYLVLLRCKVDSGTVGLQMRQGYIGGDTVPSEEVFIDHTSYKLIELGEFRVPPAPVDEQQDLTAEFVSLCGIEIYAEQVSGTSTLYLDCVAMIPTAHFFSVNRAPGTGPCGTDCFTRPNDEHIAIGRAGSSYGLGIESMFQNWAIPPGDSTLVAAAQGESSHNMSDSLIMVLDYYPRYLMYR